MKKLLITLFGALALSANASDNWTSQAGAVKNSTDLCWRDSNWTPATAEKGCDGAPVAAKPAPVVAKKVSLESDTLFAFDSSVITVEGREKLRQVVAQINRTNVEVIIATGYTDWIGTDAYNLKLGQRRAEAVKAYLVSQGVEPGRVYTNSKGKADPVANNATSAGRAQNRRVIVEIVGTTK